MNAETRRTAIVIFVNPGDVSAAIVGSTDREEAAARPLLERIAPALEHLRSLVKAE